MVEHGVRDVAGARSDVANWGRSDLSQRSGRRPPPPAGRETRTSRRRHRFGIFNALRRLWIPLVILAVIGAGGFTVSRLHGIFGADKQLPYGDTRIDNSRPFNPKHLTYEVFGPPGTRAEISYFDINGDPQHMKGVPLPWSLDFAISPATAAGSVIAQGDSDSIGCRILVDGVVKAEKTTHEVSAFTYCLLKSA